MSTFKTKIDFSGYPGPQLSPLAQAIHDGLAANAPVFPALPLPLTTLQADITAFNAALAKKASRATADIVAFEVARHTLESALGELGGYVNGVARGNETILLQSGFPYYQTSDGRANTAPPAAPDGVVLRQGDLSGSFVARFHPARTPSMNETQTCTGDPNVEANWQHAGMYGGGRATVSGIAPGTAVWFRVRTAGLKGVMGAWSDPAKIMVV